VAVADNTTPTEKRQGLADSYSSAAAVRGGAMLIKRVAPELLAGYQRYYLQAANVPRSDGDAEAALARAYRLARLELAAPRPRPPRTRPLRQLFGLAFDSRPPPVPA
jgi:hypothetical protein